MASRAPTRATPGLLVGEEVLAFLGEASANVGAALDYERSLADAASAAVPRFADWCSVDIVTPAGGVRQITSGELAPEHEALLAELRDADCAGVVREGPRVHLVAPLVARARTLGAITFLLTAPGRQYGDGDVEVARELARRLALAVDNARLYETLERSSARAAFLADASASVGGTLDFEQVLATAARAAVPRFADWCGVDIVQPDGSLRQITSPLEDPEQEALLMELRRRYRDEYGASAGAMRVIETGEPELASDVRERAEIALRSDETATYARLAPQSYMIVPLIAGDQMLGAMTFLSTTPGYLFDESDLSLASDLARRLALAVENARLYEDAERARARVSFVAEASEVLASSLDLETTLQRLARLAVPRLADLCRVYLIDPDGTLRMLAVAHCDPRKAALSSEMQERFPVRPSDPNGATHVVLTGEPQLIPELSDEMIEGAAQNEEHLRMLRELDMRSALSVPLVGRDGPLGAFTLIAGSSRPRLGEDDLRIGADLARRAAVAVENARLHAAVAEAAARSQESLALVIDSVSDYAIFSLDPEGRVESWNPGAERINGFRAEEIIGEHFSRFYTREDIERGHPAHELEVAAAEGRYAEEAWRLRKDGSRYWANVLITALRSTDGELRGFAKVTRDMSARKRADEELRRSNEELERYAYVASHDLSEPLRAIAGFSGLLRRRFGDRLGTEGEGFVDAIADGVERMQALIDDLLTFSRLDRAARDLAPVATAEVVAESVRALGSAIAETGGRVEVSGSLPVVLGQPSLLGQLFQNLIGNALKFAGEDLPVVVVSAERVGEHWRFSVRDNGIGIDPGDRDRIFDIFERLHGRDEFGGTGMGLAICRKAVELHGGQIWVQSAPDGGTEFRFTLPARES